MIPNTFTHLRLCWSSCVRDPTFFHDYKVMRDLVLHFGVECIKPKGLEGFLHAGMAGFLQCYQTKYLSTPPEIFQKFRFEIKAQTSPSRYKTVTVGCFLIYNKCCVRDPSNPTHTNRTERQNLSLVQILSKSRTLTWTTLEGRSLAKDVGLFSNFEFVGFTILLLFVRATGGTSFQKCGQHLEVYFTLFFLFYRYHYF